MAKWTSWTMRPLSRIGEDSNPSSPDLKVNSSNGRVAGIRRATFILAAPTDAGASRSADNESSGPPSSSTVAVSESEKDQSTVSDTTSDKKPLIADVKLLKKPSMAVEGLATFHRRHRPSVVSRPSFALDDCVLPRLNRKSSTFNDLHPLRSVFIEVGDYQTLLRPADITSDDKDDEQHGVTQETDKGNAVEQSSDQSLAPSATFVSVSRQPSYGEDTLRAMAVITEKFDSFRRRQMRVKSFMKSRSNRDSEASTSGGRVACSRDNSTTSRRSSSMRRLRHQQRVAADHQMALPPPETDGDEASEGGHVTAAEVERVRLFYSSLLTVVVVCRSLADLFVGACAAKRQPNTVGKSASGQTNGATSTATSDGGKIEKSDSTVSCGWIHLFTGVPLLVLSTGVHGRRRELSLVVADRGTAFPVWTDRINYMSEYRQVSPGIHTLHVSGGLTKRVQLVMFGRSAADEFIESFRQMTSDPTDELWKLSDDRAAGGRSKNRCDRKKKTVKSKDTKTVNRKLTVADISRPCNARWVTRVDADDPNFRSAFAAQLPVAVKSAETTSSTLTAGTDGAVTSDESFRPRLPTQ